MKAYKKLLVFEAIVSTVVMLFPCLSYSECTLHFAPENSNLLDSAHESWNRWYYKKELESSQSALERINMQLAKITVHEDTAIFAAVDEYLKTEEDVRSILGHLTTVKGMNPTLLKEVEDYANTFTTLPPQIETLEQHLQEEHKLLQALEEYKKVFGAAAHSDVESAKGDVLASQKALADLKAKLAQPTPDLKDKLGKALKEINDRKKVDQHRLLSDASIEIRKMKKEYDFLPSPECLAQIGKPCSLPTTSQAVPSPICEVMNAGKNQTVVGQTPQSNGSSDSKNLIHSDMNDSKTNTESGPATTAKTAH